MMEFYSEIHSIFHAKYRIRVFNVTLLFAHAISQIFEGVLGLDDGQWLFQALAVGIEPLNYLII